MASSSQNWLESLHILYLKFLGTDKNWVDSVYVRFFEGAILGGCLFLLPLLYSEVYSLGHLTKLQLGLSLAVVLTCGVLTVKLGDKFFDAVMKGFGNSEF